MRIFRIGMLIATVVLTILFFSDTWRTGDEARYYALSLSIAHGEGYVMPNLPVATPENVTPPLFPYLVAGIVKMVGDSVLAAKIFSALCYIAAVWLVILLLERLFPNDPFRTGTALILGLFPVGILTVTCWIMSDMLYILIVYGTLLLVTINARENKGHRQYLLIGVLCALAYLSRSAGLALLAGCGGYILLRRQWRSLGWYVLGILCVSTPWIIRNMLIFGVPDPYISYLSLQTGNTGGMDYPWERILQDLSAAFPTYFFHIMPSTIFYELFDGRVGNAVGKIGALIPFGKPVIAILVLLGFVKSLRKFSVLETFWIFHWLLICSMPLKAENSYYLFPIIPIAGIYLIRGIDIVFDAARRFRPTGKRPLLRNTCIASLAAYVLIVAFAAGAVHFYKETPRWKYDAWEPERYTHFNSPYMDAWGRFVEAGIWIGNNTPTNALVASRKPIHMRLFANRKGWGYHMPTDMGYESPWEALEGLSLDHPVYLIEDAFGVVAAETSYGRTFEHFMRPVMQEHAGMFKLEYSTDHPTTHVWRVMGSPKPGDI